MGLQILTVVLFTLCFSEALALQCANCTSNDASKACKTTVNCTASEKYCSSMTNYNGIPASYSTEKMCKSSCLSWSVNLGFVRMTSLCCDSDYCNNVTDSTNNMMCPGFQNVTVACKGAENQCLSATVNGTITTAVGCATKSFCESKDIQGLVMTDLKQMSISVSFSNITCNRGQSLTQGSVLLLLVATLSILFSISNQF